MFSKKIIKATILLRQGTFSDGSGALEIMGLPISVDITKQGGEGLNDAKIVIENLKQETVAQLTTLSFKRQSFYRNIIKIEAGETKNNLSLVFTGDIATAIPNYNGTTLSLVIEAYSGFYAGLLPTPPTSIKETINIADLMQQFANEGGFTFENNGVSGSVQNCVFTGSPVTKARELARQVGIDIIIDDEKLLIQPFNPPKGAYIPIISAETGMLGYPSFSSSGINIKCLFNENIRVGRHVQIRSVLPQATGEWQVVRVHHKIEAFNPKGGVWQTDISCCLIGSDTYFWAS